MKRWMKRIGIICLIPMVLVILISILLYIPPFQNFAVRLATEYASETTGMNIRIGQIRLSFPLNLTVRDVKVITPPDTGLPSGSQIYLSRHIIVTRKFPGQHPSAATAEKRSIGGCNRPAWHESQYRQSD